MREDARYVLERLASLAPVASPALTPFAGP